MRHIHSLPSAVFALHPQRPQRAAFALLAIVGALGCGNSKQDTSDGGAGISSVPAASTPATTSTSTGTTTGTGTTTLPSNTQVPSGQPTPTTPTQQPTQGMPTTEPSGPDVTEPAGSVVTDDTAPQTDDATETDPGEDSVTDATTPDPGTDTIDAAAPDTSSGGTPPDLSQDEMPWFSFFTTSLTGLLSLAPDPENGFGGDFGGLQGADEICKTLALTSNPTDAKTWRAFLSTGGFDGNTPVDAIDRIGEGPWYDYNGRLLAEDLEGLIPGEDGRPNGDPQLTEMFTDEFGEVIKPSDDIDNHDTLTGSNEEGRLYTEDDVGELATCSDWTDNTLRDENVVEGGDDDGPSGGGGFGGGSRGRVPVGHSWPRSESNGRNWSHEHNVNGCEPGVFIGVGGGAPSDNFTVGGGGGYGAFYCFALDAEAP